MIYSKFIQTCIYKRANGIKSILNTMPKKIEKQAENPGLQYAPELEPVLSPLSITIRPAGKKEFRNKKFAYGIKCFIDAPWSSFQNVFKKNAATENIMECSTAGIINPEKIKMTHINPNAPINQNFSSIADEFVKDIDLTNTNLRGFVLGSVNYDPKSIELFNKFCNLLKALRIPFSSLKTGEKNKFNGSMSKLEEYFVLDTMGQNIAYSSKNKELLINNRIIDQQMSLGETDAAKLLSQSFDEIKLLNNDKVILKKYTDKIIKPKGKLFQEEEKILKEKAKAALNDIDLKAMYYEAIGEELPYELQECRKYAQKIIT